MEMGRLNLDNLVVDDMSDDLSYSDITAASQDEFSDDFSRNHIILDESSYDNATDSESSTENFNSDIHMVEDHSASVYGDEEALEDKEDDIMEYVDDNDSEIDNILIEAPEVIGGAYSRQTYNASNPRKHNDDPMKDVSVSTQYVAKMLNVTEQTIRNYCKEFDFYLNIETTGSGRMRFTHKNIEDIRYVMQLKEMNNFTIEQLKQYLRANNYNSVPERRQIDNYANRIEEKVLALIAEKFTNTTTLLLEEQSRARVEDTNKLQCILEEFEKQKKDFEELKNGVSQLGDLKKLMDTVDAHDKESQEQIELYRSQIEELKRENARLVNDNVDMENKVKEQEQTISELSQRKERKKFLGIF